MVGDAIGAIGFIGTGRAGAALARAFARAGEPVSAVFNRSHLKAQALAQAIPGCTAVTNAQQVADASELIFLAVSDDAIAPMASTVRWRPGVNVVHCSGVAELDVLRAAERSGAQTGSFHPLRLFAEAEPAGELRCAVAVEGTRELRARLEHLARAVGARPFHVPAGHRAAYHAASHYAAAYLCVLLAEAQKIFAAIGLENEASRFGLNALALSTLDAISRQGPAAAMAGAYARGDLGTAQRHLQALDALDAETGLFYRQLARRSVALALEAGRIDATRARELARLLDA